MTTLKELYGKTSHDEDNNLGVDYVLNYSVPPKERNEAEAVFVKLIEALTQVGLSTEVRQGNEDFLLVFLKLASDHLLAQHAYSGRLQDWLHGVRTSCPAQDLSQAFQDEPITEAERLRLVYLMITKPRNDGGAGITPAHGQWKYVESVFPLHNHAFNKKWIHQWSKKYLLGQNDLDEIRDKFGESVALYFAFLRSYFRNLFIPSAVGFAFWMLLGQFSYLFALISCLWSVVFFEHWKQMELDLAVSWGVRGVSNIQRPRLEYHWDYVTEDPVTGEPVKVYPPFKRIRTQVLQIPFALVCVLLLGGLIVVGDSLEVFINEVYSGPGKQYLTFLPTILLAISTPTISALLMRLAETLTTWENYETEDSHNAALIQKHFVLNFLTSYMPLLFTAFVYIPFGNILLPFLDVWRTAAQAITFSEKPLPMQKFRVDPARISSQMFYFTVTAQIVNFGTEVVVPYVKQIVFAKAKEFHHKSHVADNDVPEEAAFLRRVRCECLLDVYDVSTDYQEMVIQFGYLSLFSVAWPLTAGCFFINNWVELRSDALKIATSCRRPIPWRSDSMGPWLTAMGFLSWLGSITSSAIVYLCSGSQDGARGKTSHITAWGLLLSILLAEHFYLAVQFAVRYAMSKVESPGLQQERKARYLMKKKMLGETLGQNAAGTTEVPGADQGEEITRVSLEEEARQASSHGGGEPEILFWQRQRGMQETITIGRKLIEQAKAKSRDVKSAAPSHKA